MTDQPAPEERTALRKLLEAVDEGPEALWAGLPQRPTRGFFAKLGEAGLDQLDVAIVLVALSARLAGKPSLSGSDLVARAAPDSARRLDAVGRLSPESRLVSRGLIFGERVGASGPDAHATTWRLGDLLFRRAIDLFSPAPKSRSAKAPRPYRTNLELLGDLRRLSLVYRRRAAAVFHLDPWTSTGMEVGQSVSELRALAADAQAQVAARLELSDDLSVPLLALRAEHKLDLDQLVILVTVLFQELVEGVGAVDAIDLVKLVSESENDLIRRRQSLRPLVRRNLLRLEGAYADKELTADACLPNGIIEEMLGDRDTIGSDDRIDFHTYLQELESSDAFFSDLDGSDDPD